MWRRFREWESPKVMLSDADKQLITAAVDGELSAEQGRTFRDLLARSAAAVALHAGLQADRDRVRRLSRPAAPAGLHAAILNRLPQTVPARPQPAPAGRRTAAPLGMAASFLLAVGAGAYWLAGPAAAHRIATNQLQQLPKDDQRPAPADRPTPPPDDEEPAGPPAPDQPPATTPVLPPVTVATNDATPKTPDAVTDVQPGDIVAAPVGSDVKAFDRVAVKLPLLLPFADLANDDSQTALRDRLARDPATRIDLFVRDQARAVEVLTQAGRSVNLTVITETIAGERMKRKMPSTWLLYTDALTAAEVTKWLAAAAETDAKAVSPSAAVFGTAHVLTAGPHEQKEAQQILGVDLGVTKKPADAPNAHISAKTLDQVTTAMQKGDAAKPAILLTYLPPLVRVHPALSKDVKQYHELRKDRKPGTVPVMVVVRPAAN